MSIRSQSRLLVLAALSAGLVTPVAARAESRCDLPGYRTVGSKGHVRVVRGIRTGVDRGTYLACYGRRGRPLVLGDEYSEESRRSPTVSGVFVAIRLDTCDKYYGECTTAVQVSNVRRRVQQLYETGGLRRFLLAKDGMLAASDAGGGTATILRGVGGHFSEVARGPGIDPDSLALSGRRIYWMQDGQPQTAELDTTRRLP